MTSKINKDYMGKDGTATILIAPTSRADRTFSFAAGTRLAIIDFNHRHDSIQGWTINRYQK